MLDLGSASNVVSEPKGDSNASKDMVSNTIIVSPHFLHVNFIYSHRVVQQPTSESPSKAVDEPKEAPQPKKAGRPRAVQKSRQPVQENQPSANDNQKAPAPQVEELPSETNNSGTQKGQRTRVVKRKQGNDAELPPTKPPSKVSTPYHL